MSAPIPRTFVAYARVSTARQGLSGLGLEAQEAAIRSFLKPDDRLLLPMFVEVESGRKTDRPELAKALERCRTTGATLIIAKLDRLARDAHFLLGLQKAGVEFVACDMPQANRLTIGIMALVAEEEARAISARTKAALAAAKARGVTLGGRREGQTVPTLEARRAGGARGAETKRKAANQAAYSVQSRITSLQAEGLGLAAIARALQEAEVPTPRGGAWTATAVRRVLLRTSA